MQIHIFVKPIGTLNDLKVRHNKIMYYTFTRKHAQRNKLNL